MTSARTDGFNLGRVVGHETYSDFIEHIIPELQRRGRYKTEYRPGTYREKRSAAVTC